MMTAQRDGCAMPAPRAGARSSCRVSFLCRRHVSSREWKAAVALYLTHARTFVSRPGGRARSGSCPRERPGSAPGPDAAGRGPAGRRRRADARLRGAAFVPLSLRRARRDGCCLLRARLRVRAGCTLAEAYVAFSLLAATVKCGLSYRTSAAGRSRRGGPLRGPSRALLLPLLGARLFLSRSFASEPRSGPAPRCGVSASRCGPSSHGS